MYLRPATEIDLKRVIEVCAEFREHWKAAVSPTNSVMDFCGAHSDIDALDYLDYEGLEYPPSGYCGASLVWGNVVVTNSHFSWFLNDKGDYFLVGEDCGRTQAFWPYARVLEIQSGSTPQFDKYNWILFEFVHRYLLNFPDEPWKMLALLDEGSRKAAIKLLNISEEDGFIHNRDIYF